MSRRITIRVGDEDYEKLRQRCQDATLDLSFLIRDAIGTYLEGGTPAQEAKRTDTGLVMPPEAFALTGPYRAWSGDLRIELKERFLELLALAHTAAEHWPKTKGIREVYVALLSVCQHLGIGDGVRHDR